MDKKDFSSYKKLYMQVAIGNIQILKNNIPVLKQHMHDQAAIEKMHRAVHNLKTESLLMKYAQLASLCTELEKVFVQIKLSQAPPSSTFFTLIKDASSHMKQSIRHIESENKETNLSDLIHHVKNYIKNI